MIAVSPLHAAIAAHRAAYDAFQIAPEGEDSELASCELLDALDALVEAACAFPILGRSLPEGAGALLAHLQWWLTDEAVNAADYQPNYGILLGRAMDLAVVLERNDFPLPRSGERKGSASGAYPSTEPDPIIAAIVAADMANAAHTATLVHLDEDDEEQVELCNAAACETDRTFSVVEGTMPSTIAGLIALTEFYARDAKLYDRCSGGSEYLAHVARALIAWESSGRFSGGWTTKTIQQQLLEPVIPPGENRALSGVPGQAEVEAAWHALSMETRDAIGIIATDMVFQAFVSGDAFGPKDQPVPGRSKRAQKIRGEASDACCRRLTELHIVIEDALPALFGSAGQNPDWAVAMGAQR
ncbi:hypothetical protein ABC766_27070 [Methylobacterium fujisawaense]|uniref:hypothetical protein n=1 Tax=Methylobacterium fujisawaense TaxID=107400 RepID=UPI0031F4EF24